MRYHLLLLLLSFGVPIRSRAQLVSATVPAATAGEGRQPTSSSAVDYAEEMPAFPGGAPALRRYLATKLEYPAEARQRQLSGKVVMQFIVDEQGRIVDATVVRASDPVFEAAAKRVIYLMPWWTPGREQGHPVRVRCTLPLVFTYQRG